MAHGREKEDGHCRECMPFASTTFRCFHSQNQSGLVFVAQHCKRHSQDRPLIGLFSSRVFARWGVFELGET